MVIIYVDDPENCKLKIGDTLKFKDDFRPAVRITGIRKSKPEREPKHCICPHCGGDLDDYMEA